MRDRRRGARTGTLSVLVAVMLAAPVPLLGQTDPQGVTPPNGPQPSAELTAEAIQQRLQQVAEATDLDEEAKGRIQDLYRQALEQLRLADDWATKLAGFESAVQEAPALLEAIKAELAKPPVEPMPEVPADASLTQLDQLLAQVEADLSAAQKQASDLDTELKRRADRRIEIPKQLAEAQQRLTQVTEEMTAVAPADEPVAISQARRTLLLARKKACEQEVTASEREILSYDARGELLTARRDQAARRLTQTQKMAKAWQTVVAERRRQEAELAAQQAEETRRSTARAHPAVRDLAEENARLTEQRTELAGKIEVVSKELEDATATLSKLKTDAAALQERVAAAGLTRAISVLLRKQRADLPDLRFLRRGIRARQSEISDVNLQLLELHDERAALADVEQRTEQFLAEISPSVSAAERQDIEGAVRSLLQAKRDYLDSLLKDLDTYFTDLVDLDAAERQLIKETKDFRNYIDENILWFRSTARLGPADFPDALEGLRWLAQGKNWTEAGVILKTDARTRPVLYGLALVVFAAWLFVHRRLVAALHKLANRIRRATTDSFGHTIVGFAVTVTLAAGWPALMGFLAWRIWDGANASATAPAIAFGLRNVAALFLTLELLRQTCRARGLGELHFQWRRPGLRMVHKHLIWFMAVILPAGFIFWVIEWQQENDAWKDSLGRLTLLVGMVALAVFTERVSRPTGRLMKDFLSRNRGGWLDRLRYVWYPLAFGTPVVLAVAAAAGYQYTAAELSGRVVSTLWLVLALVFANAIMLRWLYVARRRLALERAQKRATAEAEAKEAAPGTSGEGHLDLVEEPEVDIFSISVQTRQLVRSLVGVALLLGLWFIWADVLPALGILDRVHLWSSGPDEYVTLASLALAVLVALVTVVAAKNFPGLLEIAILQRLPMGHGVRYAVAAMARYLIAIAGTIVAFGVIGIGWSKVQWLVAAMTVGLGFGLQEIFANFISGLIILFERPMRVGDTVTVGDITGTVTRIQIRATTIRDWNRKELIVPNKEFVTGQLINWTLSDTVIRLVIPVGIAYGSDTKLANEVLLKVAGEQAHVLREPEATALFVGFGESSLNFELRVFIPSMEHYLSVWHDLHMTIDAAFREAGIEIAFPQQDVHIRSIKPVLPIVQRKEDAP